MANIDAPKGFVPLRHVNGQAWNGATNPFLIDSGNATATGIGDVVVTAGGAGAAGTVVSGMDVEGMMTVVRASAGTTGQNIVGVVTGFLPDPTNLAGKHRLASTDRIALVCTDPTVVYECQEDADTTPLAAADMGMNAAFIVGSVDATTGVSNVEIDSSSKATTATLPLILMGLVKRPDNHINTAGAGSDNAKYEVMFNTYLQAPNSVGIS